MDTESNRPKLVIGPLFVRSSPPDRPSLEVEPLGVSLEMASAHSSFRSPLYRKVCSWNTNLRGLTDIIIQASNLPFEFAYPRLFAAQAGGELFVPMESLLVGVYEHFNVCRSVFSVFGDLRDLVEFSEGRIPPKEPLIPAAADIGFEVSKIESDHRSLCVDVDWFPPQDRGRTERRLVISSAAIDFRPLPDGTLGRGKWYAPREGFARVLTCRELRKIVPGDPIDLFTKTGKAELLNQFEWTPLARMTNKQARAARLQFVREHPDLTHDPRQLAEAMQKAGFYSDLTTLWQITKFVPSLLAEAQAQQQPS